MQEPFVQLAITKAITGHFNLSGKHVYFSEKNKLCIDDHSIKLSPTLCRLLKYLVQHPEEIFSRDDLMKKIWSSKGKINPRAVDAGIRLLRKKLREHHLVQHIQTIHGVGYRFSFCNN